MKLIIPTIDHIQLVEHKRQRVRLCLWYARISHKHKKNVKTIIQNNI